MKMRGKTAIVTGSTKGIGQGIARVFASEGARVVIVSRHAGEGARMVDECKALGGDALYVQCDVTIPQDIKALVDKTVKAFGGIDTLVNNAGYHISKSIFDTTEEDFELLYRTNLRSTFLCSKYAMPYLIKSKGSIINISSMVGLVGQPHSVAYASTKGGQIGMTRSLAIDVAPMGVRVNAICPGWIQTPLVDEWFATQEDPEASRSYIFGAHPVGRIGTSEECGKAALFLACMEDSGFITGITLNIDGGITLGY